MAAAAAPMRTTSLRPRVGRTRHGRLSEGETQKAGREWRHAAGPEGNPATTQRSRSRRHDGVLDASVLWGTAVEAQSAGVKRRSRIRSNSSW